MFDRIRSLVSGWTSAPPVSRPEADRVGEKSSVVEPAAAPASPTFCAHAWTYAFVNTFGQVQPCCEFGFPVWQDDHAMSLRQDALVDIWSSEPMQRMRREMVEGKRVAGCEACYVREDVGAQSMRQTCNAIVGEERIARFIEQSVASDFRIAPLPEVVEVVVGNRCNLKCRMCRSSSSSLIAKDRVHSAWNYREIVPVEEESVLELMEERLFRDADHIRRIHFMGGEPFVINEIERSLQMLIDRGVAHRIVLSMNTNGTRTAPRWMQLTELFQELHLTLSIDGVGGIFEYIRFPAKWAELDANLRAFRTMRHVDLDANVTVQSYNVLEIADAFRYLDQAGIADWRARTVQDVAHLRVTTMPPAARRLAAARLEDYARRDCRPQNRAAVECIIDELRGAGEDFDRDLLHEFMVFTNDLDRSRRQSFRESCPELLRSIEQAGFEWTEETRHAHVGRDAARA